MKTELATGFIEDQLLQNISTLTPNELNALFEPFVKEEQLAIFAHTLEYYGGTFGHELLLKGYLVTNTFTFSDWMTMITLMTENPALGIDTLISFFRFYSSSTWHIEAKKVELFCLSIQRYFVKDVSQEGLAMRKSRMFRKLNLTEEEVENHVLL